MTKLRKDISKADAWNLDALYPSISAWQTDFDRPDNLAELLALRAKLDLISLPKALHLYFNLQRESEKLYTWAHLKHDEDITDSIYKVAHEKAQNRLQIFAQKTSWLAPEILEMDEHIITAKELHEFRVYLEKLFALKKHHLPSREEQLMALALQPLSTAYKCFSSLTNADFLFDEVLDSNKAPHELSHASYGLYLQSKDRVLRENTFKTYHKKYSAFKNTLCDLLQGKITAHLFEAKARGFESCLEAALKPKNIPLSVYHSLIKAVKSHLEPLTAYYTFRKDLLGYKDLHLYDMNHILAHTYNIPYAKAEDLIVRSVRPLGEEYQETLYRGLQSGWVDRFENKGKRSGAYSSGCFDSPPYILMNYKEILRDVFTLGHEAGHSMHSHYSRKHQPYHYSDYPIFVAEVASTFNEQLLFNLMLKESGSSSERNALIQSQIDNIRATLFRQTMFAEFELFLHTEVEEGRPLTPECLEEKYFELLKSYSSPVLTLDDEVGIEWARIPHFYYNFYVYQYATGLSAAIALSQKVLNGNDKERNSYLNFLKGGSSKYPIDLLKEAGVDMTTTAPFEDALAYFAQLTRELKVSN
ncbi:MAG: oligoendopeptidase F [Chlamydiae bacterium]|nr:oligoendopeptidase F [Chlamydiota bacterium]